MTGGEKDRRKSAAVNRSVAGKQTAIDAVRTVRGRGFKRQLMRARDVIEKAGAAHPAGLMQCAKVRMGDHDGWLLVVGTFGCNHPRPISMVMAVGTVLIIVLRINVAPHQRASPMSCTRCRRHTHGWRISSNAWAASVNRGGDKHNDCGGKKESFHTNHEGAQHFLR